MRDSSSGSPGESAEAQGPDAQPPRDVRGPRALSDARLRNVLEQALRATASAGETATSQEIGELAREPRHLVVQLGKTRYAFPLSQVLEVGEVPTVTLVPNVAGWVRGVANVRGDVTSLVDLSRFLGQGDTSLENGRIVVVRSKTHDTTLGLLVDSVAGTELAGRAENEPVRASSSRHVVRETGSGAQRVLELDLDGLVGELLDYSARSDIDATAKDMV